MPPPTIRNRTIVWKPMVVCPHPELYRRLQTVLTELAVEQPCNLTDYPRGGLSRRKRNARLQHRLSGRRDEYRAGARSDRRTVQDPCR